jgi:hypothetical protein
MTGSRSVLAHHPTVLLPEKVIPGTKFLGSPWAGDNSFQDRPVLDSNPARAGVRFNSNHVDLD